MKLLRRRQPEPEPVDEADELRRWEQLLQSHRTWAPRSVVRDRYHAEQRQQQQRQRAGMNAPPTNGTSQSRSAETHAAAPPQPRTEIASTHPANPEPVPSAAPAEGPAPKTQDEWAYEHFLAFETLCGNADRIAERIEEARTYEPEQAPPVYVW